MSCEFNCKEHIFALGKDNTEGNQLSRDLCFYYNKCNYNLQLGWTLDLYIPVVKCIHCLLSHFSECRTYFNYFHTIITRRIHFRNNMLL